MSEIFGRPQICRSTEIYRGPRPSKELLLGAFACGPVQPNRAGSTEQHAFAAAAAATAKLLPPVLHACYRFLKSSDSERAFPAPIRSLTLRLLIRFRVGGREGGSCDPICKETETQRNKKTNQQQLQRSSRREEQRSSLPKISSTTLSRRWLLKQVAEQHQDMAELVEKKSVLVKEIKEVLDEQKSTRWSELHVADNYCFHYCRSLLLAQLDSCLGNGEDSFSCESEICLLWKQVRAPKGKLEERLHSVSIGRLKDLLARACRPDKRQLWMNLLGLDDRSQ
ncbi:protein prenyltransferase alpha subunit repeat-containing protein 1-B [Panicum miliaceum]|uniref:Protein prenyltransferase alpha subunit repeat-containing protein 1-B n=1 Tax=Panicum miliaceum TaxID=4540 RepID=A0A3L6R4F9_PANMI|nr:protein prenyltransferase alpha subunit repeat-containing protein 1-B [Panicum miliaceum]